jgi:hypothetical protein
MKPSPDTIIAVFELRPFWGPELQRQFGHSSIVIRECRAVNDLLPSTDGFEKALIVIDLDSAIENCIKWLGVDVKQHLHQWPIIACGSAATADFEWPLREAGVTAFLPEIISGDAFAKLCRRQLGANRREESVQSLPAKRFQYEITQTK